MATAMPTSPQLQNGLQKRSSTMFSFIFGGGVISAVSSLQKLTAESTIHAELIAMATAAREAIYLQGVVSELGFPCGPTPLHSDSSGALSTAGNSSFRGRSKFLATRFYLLRQSVDKGDILVWSLSREKTNCPTYLRSTSRGPSSSSSGMPCNTSKYDAAQYVNCAGSAE